MLEYAVWFKIDGATECRHIHEVSAKDAARKIKKMMQKEFPNAKIEITKAYLTD